MARTKKRRRGRATASYRRRRGNRPPRKCVLIVCEGEKTEPIYFRSLRAELKLTHLEVEVQGEGAAPITVVDSALEIRRKRSRESKRAARRGDLNSKPAFDEVWCVFDVERLVNNPSFHQAVDKAQGNNLELGVSNPAFEYWYVLHFEYTTRPFADASDVIRQLRVHIADYAKSLDIFSRLYEYTDDAIERAKRVWENRPTPNESFPNSSTGVFRLVEMLKAMTIL